MITAVKKIKQDDEIENTVGRDGGKETPQTGWEEGPVRNDM